MIRRELFRLPPQGPPEAYKTYQVLQPRKTHFRKGTCAEVDSECGICGEKHCAHNAHGWVSKIDVSTDLGRRQANYIRLHSGRVFTHTTIGLVVTFVFPAGQTCFREHRISLQRPPVLRVKGGDFRGNPMGLPTIVRSPDDWLDDFGMNQIAVKARIERG